MFPSDDSSNAKTYAYAWDRRIRRTRLFLFSTAVVLTLVTCFSTFAYLSSAGGFITVNLWREEEPFDPLWSHKFIDPSQTIFPPQDPIYTLFVPPNRTVSGQSEQGKKSLYELHDVRRFSPGCLDDHFENGSPCHIPDQDAPLDVVWTWVNGSDRLIIESMTTTAERTVPKRLPPAQPNTELYREHAELLHSVRSVLKHFRSSTSKLHIVTSDFDMPIRATIDGDSGETQRRLGLVPYWLDTRASPSWRDGDIDLNMVYHSHIFSPYDDSNFNSYAIESQLSNMPGVSENFIYMNDDFFMMADLTAPDFYTSSFGYVLRMQSDLLVRANRDPHVDSRGEWGPLEYTNWCLSNRFGFRPRPYIAHTAKALSIPLLKEFSSIWKDEISVTASHPFRGMTDGNRDIYAIFMFAHSLVERWREGLLWSWAVAKHGGMSDEWGPDERLRAWEDVGGIYLDNKVNVISKERATLNKSTIRNTLLMAGHKISGQTRYNFASGDGYPYGFRSDLKNTPIFPTFNTTGKPVCELEYTRCFGKHEVTKASEFFKHIAFDDIACGDCIINALRVASGPTGLSKFLPDATRTLGTEEHPEGQVPHLPLVSDWREGNFSLQSVLPSQGSVNIRAWTIRMLERYRFVIGDTPIRFHMVTSFPAAKEHLKLIDEDPKTALLCLNDNLSGQNVDNADQLLREWQERRWGTKAAWER
ncbi:hypothetical protein BU17DRAFT_49433 [Hysterangium stoloniferum]|nr:hypothetical protein BU17DRAFT_49433 [Hysterangium stoloniferum]